MKTVLRRQWPQIWAALAASVSLMMAGVSLGWTSVALDDLLAKDSPIPMTLEESSWMVSVINLGNLVSPIPTSMVASAIGRKWCLLTTAPVYFCSWVIVICAPSVWVLVGSRAVQGAVIGALYTVVPMYISEISEPNIRGVLGSLPSIAMYVGILFVYIFGNFLNFINLIFVILILPLLCICVFFTAPESPYYLTMRGLKEDAERSLKRLRTGKIDKDLDEIFRTIDEESKNNTSWIYLFSDPTEFRFLILGIIIIAVKLLSGSPTINAFANQTFALNNDSTFTPSQFSISLGVVILISTILSGSLVDRVGRRPLLLISTLGCAVSNTSTAIYYYFQKDSKAISKFTFIPFLTISITSVFYSLGLSPLPPIIRAEIGSSKNRSIASGITISVSIITLFVSMKTYQTVIEAFGMYVNFIIFSTVCYAGLVFIFIALPETKCKTFAEIQNEATKRVVKIQPDLVLSQKADEEGRVSCSNIILNETSNK